MMRRYLTADLDAVAAAGEERRPDALALTAEMDALTATARAEVEALAVELDAAFEAHCAEVAARVGAPWPDAGGADAS